MSAKFETSFPAPEWVHASDLTTMALSPAHYFERVSVKACPTCEGYGETAGPGDRGPVQCDRCDGTGVAKKERYDSPAMLFGRVVHVMVLGYGEFVVWPGKRTDKGWKEFKARNEGIDIITGDEEERARAVAAAVLANPLARPLLEGEMEREYEWTNGGRKCAGRLDIHTDRRIVDLKTTSLAQPDWFVHHGIKLSYHAKKAWYVDGMRARGLDIRESFLIAAESKAPFPVTVFKLTEAALEEGRRSYRHWLEQLLVCEASKEWPAYAQSIVDFDVSRDVDLIFPDDEEEAA